MKQYGRFRFYKDINAAMIMNLDLSTPQIQAVLLDIDGVLVDSPLLYIQSWNEVLFGAGLPNFENELCFSSLGRTNPDMLTAYCKENQITLTEFPMKEFLIRKEATFCENLNEHTHINHGVITWLDYFKSQGLPSAVVPSSTMANIISHPSPMPSCGRCARRVQAARNANMTCCAIATSYPKHLSSSADLMLDFLANLALGNLFSNDERKK